MFFHRPGNQQAVTFASRDGTVLAGSLVFPEAPEEILPAVIVLHGAERATRSFAYRMLANVFLERGFAMLLYDKRGAGDSGGGHPASFEQLIDDALAGMRFLERHGRIHREKIGIEISR